MAKVVTAIILAVALLLGILWFSQKKASPERVDDLMVVKQNAVTRPETLGISTNESSRSSELKTYIDESLGYKIQYPKDISLEKEADGSVVLSGSGLGITITGGNMSGIDTINTVAERHINEKIAKLGEKFKLSESISPVSIGYQTGITYTSEEASKEITYFYVPQRQGYILLINRTDTSDYSLISASDDIIYSLELL